MHILYTICLTLDAYIYILFLDEVFRDVLRRWISNNMCALPDDWLRQCFTIASFDILVVLICLGLSDLRQFLYQAHRRGMTSPDYVYMFYPYNIKTSNVPWIDTNEQPESDEELQEHKNAFMSVKRVWY